MEYNELKAEIHKLIEKDQNAKGVDQYDNLMTIEGLIDDFFREIDEEERVDKK